MTARDHHVANQAPNWSRPSQAFRKFDGTQADWRVDHPGRPELARLHRTGLRARLRRIWRTVQTGIATLREWAHFENILLGPAGNRRDIAVFVVGMAWGVMCSIGAMAAWGIHP